MGLQRNYQGKVDALDDLMRRYPNSQYIDDALYEKSRALVMMNREGEAINVLQQLVSNYPNSALSSQAGIQLGQLYYNTGNYQNSITAYKECDLQISRYGRCQNRPVVARNCLQ